MRTGILERIHTSLSEKRVGLIEWINTTPSDKKQVLLGTSTEQAVHTHLSAIDDCIDKAESGTLGQCKVCKGTIETNLLEVDYTARVCIEHLSEEEVDHLENQLTLAQSVQKTLLPQEIPNVPGLEIAAFSRPAQIVGGDYFDFIEFGSGYYGLTIADVAGHGVSASLHMASIHAMLHAIASMSESPAELVSKVHELFVHNIRFTTFVTFFVGAFDPAAKTFTYCNAGHNPPIVLHQEGNGAGPITWLKPTGAAIGLIEETEFGEQTITLRAGDLVVMYTDGVTEATNPQNDEYGRERLAALIKGTQGAPQKVVQEIKESLEVFCEGKPLEDDTTVVVLRVT
ncbi:MAG: SpoIIE family protein phosphatase [Chloroflexi bacterium]|nr:SpoIIE family protein phosphatase [Chloroflexota bacterium]